MSFVGMLGAAQFVLLYGTALSRKGLNLGAEAWPNAAFVLGIVLYTVFKLDTDKLRQKSRKRRLSAEKDTSLLTLLRNASDGRRRRRADEPATETPQATESS
jgi:hypothetical protein